MTKKTKIIFIAFGLLAAMQLIRIDKDVPAYDMSQDLLSKPIAMETRALIVNSCYDCHSYTTTYPWYAEIAPVSWWLNNHVKAARNKLNFSIWDSYTAEDKLHVIKDVIKSIGQGKMPLKSYTWLHSDTKLTREQKDKMIRYFEDLSISIK